MKGVSTAILACCLMGAPVFAQQPQHDHDEVPQSQAGHESHGSHQHGLATLTFVLEGNEVELAFDSPAASLVGFEHKPKDAAQQQKLQQVLDGFRQGHWFSFDAAAGCVVNSSEISSELEREAEHGHADLNASYSLLCQDPEQLKQLSIQLAELGPGVEKVSVQWIVNGVQGAAEWTPALGPVSLQ